MIPNPKQILLSTFRKLLRAIIRTALRNGINCVDFYGLNKELYVEVCRNEFGIKGRPTNLSRISAMTGIQRNEVKRIIALLESSEEDYQHTESPDKMAGVLAMWHSDARYLDSDNKPIDIPLEGDHPSFTALVRSITIGGNVPVSTILVELKRAHAVEKISDDRLCVKKRYFVPGYAGNASHSGDAGDIDEEQAVQLANRITTGFDMLVDHANTVFHNTYAAAAKKDTRLELQTVEDDVDVDYLPEFYQLVDELGLEFIERLDTWLVEHVEKTKSNVNARTERLGLGVYAVQGENETKDKPDV